MTRDCRVTCAAIAFAAAVLSTGAHAAAQPPGDDAVRFEGPADAPESGRASRAGWTSPARRLWRTLARGDLEGFVAADARWFFHGPVYEGQVSRSINPSVVLQPEYRCEWHGGNDRIAVVPFARLDFDDPKRRHWDLRELNWLHAATSWDVRFGVAKVFWGVTESRHLVDVINQDDSVEDVDGEDKLGQPMIKIALHRRWGTLEMFALPRFRERTFPGRKGRLRFSIPVTTGRPVFESSLEEWHPDGAVRWSHFIGDWDFGLSHFSGTSREPRFLLQLDPSQLDPLADAKLRPRYDIIHQTSIDVQATKGSWLWKLEAMTRDGHPGGRFAGVVAGFEYTIYGLFRTAADLGLLGEYLYDGRDSDVAFGGDLAGLGTPPPEVFGRGLKLGDTPPTPLDNDVFGALRFTPNDAQSTAVLAGAVVDADTQTTLFTVEASRRIGDRWVIELDVRAYLNSSSSDLLFFARDDDHMQLRIARYF